MYDQQSPHTAESDRNESVNGDNKDEEHFNSQLLMSHE